MTDSSPPPISSPPPPSDIDALLVEGAPISQESRAFRKGWPSWLKQMPRLNFPPINEQFELIDRRQLVAVLKEVGADQEVARRIAQDLRYLDRELLRLFRERDYEAKFQQNRYRLYQISYLVLAATATLLGSLLALFLEIRPDIVPLLALGETFVALLTTYLATISGREPPLQMWLDNRRRAENLRREYFRYLANVEPYDEYEGYEREAMLSRRAADINRGFFPGQNPDEGR